MIAVTSGDLVAVEFLLENEAKVDAEHSDGFTPMMCALRTNNLKAVELLRKYGADVNNKNRSGTTPLKYELTRPKKKNTLNKVHNTQAIDLLLKLGANVNIEDNSKKTPVSIALNHGKVEAAKLLLYQCGDINKHISNGSLIKLLNSRTTTSTDNCLKIIKLSVISTLEPFKELIDRIFQGYQELKRINKKNEITLKNELFNLYNFLQNPKEIFEERIKFHRRMILALCQKLEILGLYDIRKKVEDVYCEMLNAIVTDYITGFDINLSYKNYLPILSIISNDISKLFLRINSYATFNSHTVNKKFNNTYNSIFKFTQLAQITFEKINELRKFVGK